MDILKALILFYLIYIRLQTLQLGFSHGIVFI